MSIYQERIIEIAKSMPENLIKEDAIKIVAKIGEKYLELYGDEDLSDDDKVGLHCIIHQLQEPKKSN